MIVFSWVVYHVVSEFVNHGFDLFNVAVEIMGNCISRPGNSSKNKRSSQKAGERASASADAEAVAGASASQDSTDSIQHVSHTLVANGTPLVSTLTFVDPRAHSHLDGRDQHRVSGSSLQARMGKQRNASGMSVDDLVMETLRSIRTLVEVDQEPPRAMLLLHKIAEKESGWVSAVLSMIQNIPISDPLGPAVVILLLDECPLPTKTSMLKLCEELHLKHPPKSLNFADEVQRHRNICIVLGCLAEKLAGPNSISLMTDYVLEYLISNLRTSHPPIVILSALIALEKFALTSDNKIVIESRLVSKNGFANSKKKKVDNPLERLEEWVDEADYVKRQVGFCAQWNLDNLFVMPDRKYTYETIDTQGVNVMLNMKDVSEYLKIAPNGLEARCDVASFESVRCTFQVNDGVWYFEVLIITDGVMQIGLATKQSKFLNYEGHGIGDDEFSIAYDGCRQLIWYNAKSSPHTHPCWAPGDVLGVLLDADYHQVTFSLNGNSLEPHTDLFTKAKSGFFAAASFMSFQQCEFNFGAKPFKFPPDNTNIKTFNDFGVLQDEDKKVLPRPKLIESLQTSLPAEGACEVCFDNIASVQLLPCGHMGFCTACSMQLEACPLCRVAIEERVEIS